MYTLSLKRSVLQRQTHLLSSLLLLFFVCTAAQAQITRYVSTTGITPAASATSWATSTTDLQGAINASQSGDQVWVAGGVYKPTTTTGPDSRTISFSMKNGVAIYGGFVGTETTLSQRPAINPVAATGRPATPSSTTLSGDLKDDDGPNFVNRSDNSYHVISNSTSLSLTNTAILNGFVITGGNADGFAETSFGGGILNQRFDSPSLINCVLQNNQAVMGGAVFNLDNCSPGLLNCLLQNNQASFGGALTNSVSSKPTLTNCVLQSNTAINDGRPNGSGYGGAIYNANNSHPVLINCVLQNNTASIGGLLYNRDYSTSLLTNSVVWNNGGSNTMSGNVTVQYCLFDGTSFISGPGNLTTATSPFSTASSVALAPCSPAINAGDPASSTVTSDPYSATALPATDLAGNPRIAGGRVDIGAVEYQPAQYPARLYVAASQTATAGDGLSWTTAFPDLQSALTYPCSQSLTEIWVAAGTYKPTSTTARDISFSMKNGVSILGGFPATGTPTMAERNPASYPTILSGDLNGDDGPDFSNNDDNSLSVINNSGGLTTSALLDGFIITGGNGQLGGGVYNGSSITSCNPSFRNCSFISNSAGYGGAMFNESNASPVLINCTFFDNSAPAGGAMFNNAYIGNASPVLTNCTFYGNSAQSGGAMHNSRSSGQSSPVLTNCIIFGNGGSNAIVNVNASVTARYSLFENGETDFTADPTNLTGISASPFAGTATVALAPCSPAINAGNPDSRTVVSAPYSVTALPATDLTGSPRITGTRIDMGAVEYQNLNGVPLDIIQQPVAGSVVCAGTTVVMSVSVAGSAPAYRWYRSGTALTGIASATTANLTLTNVQTADAGSYSVIISGDCPSVTSTAFSLTVNALPSVTVTAAPSSTLSCTNQSLTLTAQTSATTFVWSNGGSTGPTLPVSQTGVYSVTVTDANGCTAVSNSPTISRDNTSPTVSVSALSSTLTCTQPQLTLTATASTTALLWSTGQTTATISVRSPGTYSVTATGANGCSAVSNNLTIGEDFSLPSFRIASATVCPGQSVNLTASVCNGQIRWSTGATTAMITLTAGSSTSTLTATCTTGVCSAAVTGQVVVGGIQPPPAQILSFTADESACPVRLTGRGIATAFTMTGPNGYVFSTVYREGATREAIGLNVKQPGTYTLTATYTNSCGTSTPVSRSVAVSRSCP